MDLPCDAVEVARLAGERMEDYDHIIVADGSGTTADTPCGWSALVHDVRSGNCFRLDGGSGRGSNNFAELAPFVHALWGLHERLSRDGPPSARVLCLTDSQVTARCGSGQYGRNANLALWAALDWVTRNGIVLTWRWLPRNRTEAMRRNDARGRQVRLLLEGLERPPASSS
jgi:ribonuclease HI